ncbi:V/A-type H+-transporting ATPase subunit F [Lachnospiraceae bacterium]|nr:V/A-type H+-transporting ATPase subunit F [Lachnospiraceae bacterium]
MDDENKIAVIGDYDSIYGFASLGLSTFPVEGEEDAVRTLKNLAGSGYGIIYITEELAKITSKQIEKYREVMTPAIIQIPGVKGNTGDGIRAVRRSVEQAVGSDILFGE